MTTTRTEFLVETPARYTQLMDCYPNPFNPSTTIGFELAIPATVNLAIFDLGGRLVNDLIVGAHIPEGHSEVRWDGRDNSGRLVPASVYFCRLEAGGYVETRRMTMLK